MIAEMQDFRNLMVWQRGHRLSLAVYKVTRSFPRAEQYGLTSQLRRAVVSVAANIAEGSGRGSDAAMRQYLVIAHGSATEVECLLVIARDLGMLSSNSCDELLVDIRHLCRMLNGFIRRLASSRRTSAGSPTVNR
ncbi:MAG: four helix bundle protein [Gemmatimonadota bacterium]